MGRPKGSGAGPDSHLYKHGYTGTRLHSIWKGMRKRCRNPKESCYPRYGGAGISVCDEWQEFVPFMQWALANGYRDDLTIERKNGSLGYSPSNCIWADHTVQNRNRSTSVMVEYDGKTMNLSELSEITGVNYDLLKQRIQKLNWPVAKAVSTPSRSVTWRNALCSSDREVVQP